MTAITIPVGTSCTIRESFAARHPALGAQRRGVIVETKFDGHGYYWVEFPDGSSHWFDAYEVKGA